MGRPPLVHPAVGQPDEHVKHVAGIHAITKLPPVHVREEALEHHVGLSPRPVVHVVLDVSMLGIEGADAKRQRPGKASHHGHLPLGCIGYQLKEVVYLPEVVVRDDLYGLVVEILQGAQV